MAVLGEIRKRPILLMGIIALALLAFLVNPETFDKFFGKDPNILGEVNGEKITREEYLDHLFVLQSNAQQQGQPTTGLEEQAWQMAVQSKLIAQEFDKMGFEMTDDYFWNQLQFDPMFAQNPQNFDEKGNFKLQEIKKQIDELKNGQAPEFYNQWLKAKKSIETRMMARQVFGNLSTGITTGKKEAELMMKQRDQVADIDFVKVDYSSYLAKNPIKVTAKDIEDYIKQYPNTYKTDPSVNLGVVYFPSVASAADEAAKKKEIENLFSGNTGTGENFQNTKSDSMFVMMNSEMPYDPRYLPEAQLPPFQKDWAKSAAVGQILGPVKENNLFVMSKLISKKPTDSVLSKHILIAYSGAERSTATRTKEEAKKKADSLFAVIKANPATFTEGLKISDEPEASERNGSVGWVTPDSPFDPAYLAYLMNNPKGATGLVESAFGYHIINIEDKKSGAMGYKIANVIKEIKPSEATETEVDKNARKFIQQAEGKSFTDFTNLAKKGNLNYSNPKSLKRFEGMIPGLGTPKDADILAWAFNKKREKGDTEMFVVEGTGDRVVVFLNGRYEKGLANPEAVRDQVEFIVKNKLAAKKIAEKIASTKASNLEQIAKAFGTSVQTSTVNFAQPQVAGAIEPKVAGASFGILKGKLSQAIEGMTGVFVVVKKSETTNKQAGDLKQMMESNAAQNSNFFVQSFLKSLQDNAKIEDYRIDVWDKGQQ